MYFKRQFKGGGADHDPRQKLYGVFTCDACGNEEWLEIKQSTLFQYDKILTCPKCKSTGRDDLKKSLTVRKSQLELEQQRVRAEIEAVIKQLETMEV
jgi:DNA replicative helicase MCM subunit Mcm2 (Cdc46/Mcm family)